MNPVAKKLLMKPGQHWLLYNAPHGYINSLSPLPEGLQTSFEANGHFDGIQLFVLNSNQLKNSLQQLKTILEPETVLWIIYPKKSSGLSTDLEMTRHWDELSQYGLTGVAAAAIDATWTALRFKHAQLHKTSATCNSELPNTPYAEFIDVANRTVILPPAMAMALSTQPPALENFHKLSYTNKKEYILWVLTAKQDKTRTERLKKSVEKLAAGKKNPAEK
jgi:hypothetical protein